MENCHYSSLRYYLNLDWGVRGKRQQIDDLFLLSIDSPYFLLQFHCNEIKGGNIMNSKILITSLLLGTVIIGGCSAGNSGADEGKTMDHSSMGQKEMSNMEDGSFQHDSGGNGRYGERPCKSYNSIIIK